MISWIYQSVGVDVLSDKAKYTPTFTPYQNCVSVRDILLARNFSPYMVTDELLSKLFEACKNGRYLTKLHSVVFKAGLSNDNVFATKLIGLYSRFTPPETSRKLFDETPHSNVSFWNSVFNWYYKENQYKESLALFRCWFFVEKPGLCATIGTLRACARLKALDLGEMVHGFVKKTDLVDRNLFVGSALIELYSKCGKMNDALCVFEEYPHPDIVLWTSMITGYERNHHPMQALDFFARMMIEKGVVDPVTLVSLLSASAQVLSLKAGRSAHGYMIRVGFENRLFLLNALLNLYGKTGCINAAANLFKNMDERDVISWGTIIACHAHHGFAGDAIILFDEMVATGIQPNAISLVSALQACEATSDVDRGKRLHKFAARKGLDLHILVSTALIDMYMNCCSPAEAIGVFNSMPEKDAFCFSALLSGCVQNGMSYKSIEVFCEMLANDFRPDAFDLVKVLAACSELSFLRQISCFHGSAIRGGLSNNSFVSASLIESYSKCGSLDGATAIFTEIEGADVVMWSSMLAAYGFHGKGKEALEIFNQMIKHSEVGPNDVSFLSLLSACSQSGLVREGTEAFHSMLKNHKLPPNSKHYGTVVDLLGRIGNLDEAMEFISRIPEPVDANIWGAFLGACWVHKNLEMGEVAAKKLMQLDPWHAGHYVLLSNMYAFGEKWVDAAGVRMLVTEKHLKKARGESIIGIRDEICTFVANDRTHHSTRQIYQVLNALGERMKEEIDCIYSMDIMLPCC